MERDVIKDPHFFLNATIYETCDVKDFLAKVKLKAVKNNLKRKFSLEQPKISELMFQSMIFKSKAPEGMENKSYSNLDLLIHFSI